MSSSTLPVLPLPHPLTLLPHSRISIPVNRDLGQALINLIQEADAQPALAAVPVLSQTSSDSKPVVNSYVLNEWGTAARIVRLVRSPAASPHLPYVLTLAGLTRIRLLAPASSTLSFDTLVYHPVEYTATEDTPARDTVDSFKAAALRLLDRLAKDARQTSKRDSWNKLTGMVEDVSDSRAPWLADVLVAAVNADYEDTLDFLSAVSVEDRLERATKLFVKHTSISEVTTKIATAIESTLENQQKEFFLRQQLAAIQRELLALTSANNRSVSPAAAPEGASSGSELDEDEQHDLDDMADIKRKVEAMEKGSEERKIGVREWRRLKRIPQGSVEHGVIRNYLEWLTSLPWPSTSSVESATVETLKDRSFLTKAQQQLDADHFGLDKVKRRLIEYLAIVRLKQMAAAVQQEKDAKALVTTTDMKDTPAPPAKRRVGVKGPILLFVGPPGCGKTSLGQSIARALNRPFQRISLGGVRDEAEIRGHRRTYVASGPGAIVQALRKAERPDPVLLLDEIDKVGQNNFHGDPSAALLEVLDPEQNHSFNDHYINVPVDLSQVLFICTCNTLDTISAPLLDRCEIIQLSGYTYDEKLHIARRFLLPKQLSANGLDTSNLNLTEPALLHIVTRYTREAGVRSLERTIGAVVRYKAVEWTEHVDAGDGATELMEYKRDVEEQELEKILGIPRWDSEEREREERRGVVYGLVVMGQGEGGILPVETLALPGSGQLKLTGSLGDVIKESGELALSWVKTHAYALHITNSPTQDPLKVPQPIDIHLHLPAGAQKKDGPSAGIAMACAFVSLLTGACVPPNIAMTGEITLRGRVTPVGGIKEKVLGAHRARITKIILPFANRKDVQHDVATEIRNEIEFVFVRTVEEALEAAFGKGTLGWRVDTAVIMESRL